MTSRSATNEVTASIIAVCKQGHPPERLKTEVLTRIRRVVPVDALWWATSDPATLLFTSAYREEIPEETGPFFVENEFLDDDQNKWTDLARDPRGVRTLLEATDGDLHRSPRHNDIFEPLTVVEPAEHRHLAQRPVVPAAAHRVRSPPCARK